MICPALVRRLGLGRFPAACLTVNVSEEIGAAKRPFFPEGCISATPATAPIHGRQAISHALLEISSSSFVDVRPEAIWATAPARERERTD
jgi:hypothetical protein